MQVMLDDWRLHKQADYQQRMGELAAFYRPGPYETIEQLKDIRGIPLEPATASSASEIRNKVHWVSNEE